MDGEDTEESHDPGKETIKCTADQKQYKGE